MRRARRSTSTASGAASRATAAKTIIPAHAHAKVSCRLVAAPGPARHLRAAPRLRRRDRAARASTVTVQLARRRAAEPDPDRPSGDAGRGAGARGDVRAGAASTSARAARSRSRRASSRSSACRSSCSGSRSRTSNAHAPERVDGPAQLRERASGPSSATFDEIAGAALTVRGRAGWHVRMGDSAGAPVLRYGRPAPRRSAPCSGEDIRPRDHRTPTRPSPRRRRTRDWRLDTDNGSMAPRSALDVLVDLNDKVTTGHVWPSTSRSRSASPRSTRRSAPACAPASCCSSAAPRAPARRRWPSRWRATSRRAGRPTSSTSASSTTRQYLLNRLIAMESALAHLPHKTGAIKIQDVRKEILGTWMAEGGRAPQLANNPRLRPSLDRIARYGQNLFLLRGSQTASTIDNIRKLVQQHRELSGDRRLVVFVDYMQKVPQIPEPENESEKVTYIVNGLKDIALSEEVPMVCDRRRRQGRPQGVAPAQLPPARLVGDQLRGRHHPDPQREVPHRRQGQHRVQPVPGAALPRLGGRLGREEPRRPGQRGPRVREALRVLLLRPERSDGAGEAHRGAPLQRLARRASAARRRPSHLRLHRLRDARPARPGARDASDARQLTSFQASETSRSPADPLRVHGGVAASRPMVPSGAHGTRVRISALIGIATAIGIGRHGGPASDGS